MNGPGFEGYETEALLGRIVDASPDVVYAYDEDDELRLWNERATEVLGYGSEELATMSALEFVPPDERERAEAGIQEMRTTGKAVFEIPVVTADGDEIPFEIHGSELRDADGELIGRVGIGRDITDRRERQRETERRAAALSASIDGMSILDQDETYVFVNDAHAEVYGYDSPDAFIGNTWRMCYDESEQERFATEVLPELAATGSWRGEATGRKADGSPFPQELSLTTMADGGLVCVVRDISEVKRRERDLTEQKHRLDEFGTIVAHDLRGPLNVAQGHLELADGADDPGEHLRPVERALDKMKRLIEDLLTLARDGQLVADPEAVPLAQVVETARTTGVAELDSVRVEDATLRADPDRLVQLFENLFRNSVEHGSTGSRPQADDSVEQGGDPVTVRVGLLSGNDGFYVEDDGVGIPPDDRESVFDPGYSTGLGGTGFGLAIVKRIAEAHGWSVGVTTGTDGGARFEFRDVEVLEGSGRSS